MKSKILWGVYLLIIVSICWLIFIFASHQINTPLTIDGVEKTFVIKKGEGLKGISENLEESDLIRKAFWFKFYVLTNGWAARLQAGEYYLDSSLSIPQIAQKIIKGKVISPEVTVTIPEGFTLKQIDARLASLGLIQPGNIVNFNVNQISSFEFEVLNLEGYLFPDTYRFNYGATEQEIAEKMFDNFNKKLTEDLKNEIIKQGKTIEQIIIMASLIEKEVRIYEDRQIVSGVFWKRFDSHYPLQSCATIAYVLNTDKWRYSIKDTKIDSPYNTYQNIGLPIGPINNPGMSAIRAAIYPKYTDYNFFLSKPSGETVFSKTLEEHNQNKVKYLE
ncbi:MAG: endolytic transglycosylase MltG [Parcubacteria group bacterium]|nr:endolytic transglycosylase MltG [Parcubacteria group bacterium]